MRSVGVAAGLAVLVAAAIAVIAVVLSFSNETSWTDLEIGDCFDLAGAIEDADGDLAGVMSVETVSCDEPHDAEVVGAGSLNPDGDREYPSDDELFAEIDLECAALVTESLDPSTFGIVPIAPDERTWNDRDGRFVCVAVVVGGTVEGPSGA